jgi:hypothetical protein
MDAECKIKKRREEEWKKRKSKLNKAEKSTVLLLMDAECKIKKGIEEEEN